MVDTEQAALEGYSAAVSGLLALSAAQHALNRAWQLCNQLDARGTQLTLFEGGSRVWQHTGYIQAFDVHIPTLYSTF